MLFEWDSRLDNALMRKTMPALVWAVCLVLGTPSATFADIVRYTDSPGSYFLVTDALLSEFGTASFPPLEETIQTSYRVEGTGPVTLTFRFTADTGTFLFNFGIYRITPALEAIDISTDAGRVAYATQALAPGNATLIFDDAVDNPGAVRMMTANGGDLLGFFLVPDNTLQEFQTNQGAFALNGLGSIRLGIPGPQRWPFFSVADANPGGFDQLMSFSGTSAITGRTTTLFAWEDGTRIPGSGTDSAFNDLIFAVEGVAPVSAVPEPASWVLLSVGLVAFATGAARRVYNAKRGATGVARAGQRRTRRCS